MWNVQFFLLYTKRTDVYGRQGTDFNHVQSQTLTWYLQIRREAFCLVIHSKTLSEMSTDGRVNATEAYV